MSIFKLEGVGILSYGFSKFIKTESPVFSASQIDRSGGRLLNLKKVEHICHYCTSLLLYVTATVRHCYCTSLLYVTTVRHYCTSLLYVTTVGNEFLSRQPSGIVNGNTAEPDLIATAVAKMSAT